MTTMKTLKELYSTVFPNNPEYHTLGHLAGAFEARMSDCRITLSVASDLMREALETIDSSPDSVIPARLRFIQALALVNKAKARLEEIE